VGVRQTVGGACKVTGGIIDVKRFLRFLFWSPFYVFNVFLFSKRFLFKKRWQSSERQADEQEALSN